VTEAEIHYDWYIFSLFSGHHNVFELDVSMTQTEPMEIAKTLKESRGECLDKSFVPLHCEQELGQVSTLNVVHHDIELIMIFKDALHLEDIRMIQGFKDEVLSELIVKLLSVNLAFLDSLNGYLLACLITSVD
jgi:hypothetical protein